MIVGAIVGLIIGMILMAASVVLNVMDDQYNIAWLRLVGLVAFCSILCGAFGALIELAL